MTGQKLTERIEAAKRRAVVPISGFPVGAVAVGSTGRAYEGFNIEFPGCEPALTVHAEICAVTRAFQAGERAVDSLYVTETPCGHCRQFLWELSCRKTLKVFLPDGSLSLEDLLPFPFSLREGSGFLGHETVSIRPLTDEDELTALAREAAEKSYCPYSAARRGAALRGVGGTVWCGSTAENAAYNPGVTAVQAALIARGGSSEAVSSAVLFETAGGFSEEMLFAGAISTLWPDASLTYRRG
ncbi:cytidine deaminase [Jonquetella sp. BV3C21]|uniref:cytidine deaminase n=1 Tax=Jonquetella sp. BV3C21 TaxID=1111126 RepID=UPI0003AE3099|nr:cytidine deaminase [Jonquetella sp. BV3C21]ERL24280.1 putative cytidine deaminase [Jonquetella sp. BV3C21]